MPRDASPTLNDEARPILTGGTHSHDQSYGSDTSSFVAEGDIGIGESLIPSAVPELSFARASAIISSFAILVFLQASNFSVITTTQGVIAADLGVFEGTSWFTSAYLVSLSSIAPLNGKLSHIFAPKHCIFCSSLIMGVGAIITGLAPSFSWFIFGRVVTGIGSAGIYTIAIVLAIQLTPPKRRGLFQGLLNSGYTFGVAMGAVAAGALEGRFGWRVMFWLQAPIATIAAICLLLSVPDTEPAHSADESEDELDVVARLSRLDYAGASLLVVTIVLLLYSVSTPHISWIPLCISLLLFLPLFILQEAYRALDPIVPIDVLCSRAVLLTCLATLGFMMSRWSVLFFTPIYAIAVRGWSPATAGSILVPTNAGFALGGIVSGAVHIRRAGSFYASCLVVMAFFPATLIILAANSVADSGAVLVVLIVFCNGLCAGATLNYTLSHVLHLAPHNVRFIVTSLMATFRGFAGTFGSAIGGGIFERALRGSLERGFAEEGLKNRTELIRRLVATPGLTQQLQGLEKEVAVGAYVDALQSLFWSAAALGVIVLFAQAGTGWTGPQEEKVSLDEGGDVDFED
ncbi:MFS general substrate transporter [Trichodelitschia bisporula]|uniref:MFS general substrate transporter n=1 Tax=Trichodelitschia bisporula TaxID=703511 RepID=A0A6G1HL88_9PEZI|nr:MFS general substrate transporter [Trichodelitschia bisporula]